MHTVIHTLLPIFLNLDYWQIFTNLIGKTERKKKMKESKQEREKKQREKYGMGHEQSPKT